MLAQGMPDVIMIARFWFPSEYIFIGGGNQTRKLPIKTSYSLNENK